MCIFCCLCAARYQGGRIIINSYNRPPTCVTSNITTNSDKSSTFSNSMLPSDALPDIIAGATDWGDMLFTFVVIDVVVEVDHASTTHCVCFNCACLSLLCVDANNDEDGDKVEKEEDEESDDGDADGVKYGDGLFHLLFANEL